MCFDKSCNQCRYEQSCKELKNYNPVRDKAEEVLSELSGYGLPESDEEMIRRALKYYLENKFKVKERS